MTFAANISGGYPPFLYAWAFGDGSGGSGPTAFHTYHDPGNYLVQLWINDSGNGSTELTGAWRFNLNLPRSPAP